MKNIWSTVFRAVLIVPVCLVFTFGTLRAQEAVQTENGKIQFKCGDLGFGHRGGHLLNLILNRLDLTDEQKTGIQSILDEECAKIEPLVTQLKANREEIRSLTQNGSFNEEVVRTVASQQAATMVELIVAKERTKSRVYGVLTEEQRTKAEEIIDLMKPPAVD